MASFISRFPRLLRSHKRNRKGATAGRPNRSTKSNVIKMSTKRPSKPSAEVAQAVAIADAGAGPGEAGPNDLVAQVAAALGLDEAVFRAAQKRSAADVRDVSRDPKLIEWETSTDGVTWASASSATLNDTSDTVYFRADASVGHDDYPVEDINFGVSSDDDHVIGTLKTVGVEEETQVDTLEGGSNIIEFDDMLGDVVFQVTFGQASNAAPITITPVCMGSLEYA